MSMSGHGVSILDYYFVYLNYFAAVCLDAATSAFYVYLVAVCLDAATSAFYVYLNHFNNDSNSYGTYTCSYRYSYAYKL